MTTTIEKRSIRPLPRLSTCKWAAVATPAMYEYVAAQSSYDDANNATT